MSSQTDTELNLARWLTSSRHLDPLVAWQEARASVAWQRVTLGGKDLAEWQNAWDRNDPHREREGCDERSDDHRLPGA